MKEETIPEWFTGKSILITGATGFIGKILLEKLLRSCPGIKNIYLLVRSKKGKSLDERLKPYLESPLFNVIKENNKNVLNKIVCVEGDISEVGLGLRDTKVEVLTQNVNVVFHVAATIRFDQPLKDAVLINIRGTYEVIKLSKKMKNFEVLVHVSTAYANNEFQVMKEEVYPALVDWKKLIKLAEKCDKHHLDIFCRKILGLQPNTYLFTKKVAENLVDDCKGEVPVVIFRPPQVLHTSQEPIKGFMDTMQSPAAIAVTTAKGVLRVCLDFTASRVSPADWVVNGMIASAWHRAKHQTAELVYTTTSFGISTAQCRDMGIMNTEVKPMTKLWYAFLLFPTNQYLYWTLFMLLHVLPGVVLDGVARLVGRKGILLKVYRRAYVALEHIKVATNPYKMISNNYEDLEMYMSESDRKQFYIRERVDDDFIWNYFWDGINGIRMYILNESYDKRVNTIHKIQKLLHYLVVNLLAYMVYSLIPFGLMYQAIKNYIEVRLDRVF